MSFYRISLQFLWNFLLLLILWIKKWNSQRFLQVFQHLFFIPTTSVGNFAWNWRLLKLRTQTFRSRHLWLKLSTKPLEVKPDDRPERSEPEDDPRPIEWSGKSQRHLHARAGNDVFARDERWRWSEGFSVHSVGVPVRLSEEQPDFSEPHWAMLRWRSCDATVRRESRDRDRRRRTAIYEALVDPLASRSTNRIFRSSRRKLKFILAWYLSSKCPAVRHLLETSCNYTSGRATDEFRGRKLGIYTEKWCNSVLDIVSPEEHRPCTESRSGTDHASGPPPFSLEDGSPRPPRGYRSHRPVTYFKLIDQHLLLIFTSMLI